MPNQSVCHQCKQPISGLPQRAPVATVQDPTQRIPTQFEPTVAMPAPVAKSRPWWRLLILAPLLLLAVLNNPSKDDYATWSRNWLARHAPEKAADDLARNGLISLIVNSPPGEQTQAYNCGLFSVFDTHDAQGVQVVCALGIFKQFIPLRVAPRDYFAHKPEKPEPLQPAFQPSAPVVVSPPIFTPPDTPMPPPLTPQPVRPLQPRPDPESSVPPSSFGLVNPHGDPVPQQSTAGMGGGGPAPRKPRIGGSSDLPLGPANPVPKSTFSGL